MKTKTELEQGIINVTMKIHHEFPELSKYISEMPVNILESDTAVGTKNLKEYYISLQELLVSYSKAVTDKKVENTAQSTFPSSPPSEDIYNKEKQEMELNPENLSKNKAPNELERTTNEKSFKEDMSGDDLDVPGAELDDQQERIGSEDEENNYYSLGGDNHDK
jgi:hypothetical protein